MQPRMVNSDAKRDDRGAPSESPQPLLRVMAALVGAIVFAGAMIGHSQQFGWGAVLSPVLGTLGLCGVFWLAIDRPAPWPYALAGLQGLMPCSVEWIQYSRSITQMSLSYSATEK